MCYMHQNWSKFAPFVPILAFDFFSKNVAISVSVILAQFRRNLLRFGRFLSFSALSFGAQSVKKSLIRCWYINLLYHLAPFMSPFHYITDTLYNVGTLYPSVFAWPDGVLQCNIIALLLCSPRAVMLHCIPSFNFVSLHSLICGEHTSWI